MTKAKQTTPNFSNFHSQGPSRNTVKFQTALINEDGKNVILHVKYAGGGNTEFTVANMRVMKSVVNKNKGLKNKMTSLQNEEDINALMDITPEELEGLMESQNKQRNVYAKSIITGWENVSVGGEAIEYSYENCVALLEGMDTDYFKEICDFCMNRKNFDLSQNDEIDLVGEQAKNALGN